MENATEFKEELLLEKKSLEEQLATIAQPSAGNPAEWEAIQRDTDQEADPSDQADHLDEYQENRAVVDVLNARHREIITALDKIDTGTYGMCEVCNAPIEHERLEAESTASTCMAHMK
jgi:RNA polymerase-binding transcription factor DksA